MRKENENETTKLNFDIRSSRGRKRGREVCASGTKHMFPAALVDYPGVNNAGKPLRSKRE